MQNETPTETKDLPIDEFKFPTNIKQMGNVNKEFKIYMEDYVYTYLYQHAKSSGHGEKLAVLVGKYMVIDGAQVIIISGAIEAVATETEKDSVVFTDKSWDYINRQMELYFKGFCLVGWVHIQPDFGTYLMARDEAFHKKCFNERWHVLFLIDPAEKTDGFYIYDDKKISLKNSKGYFVYYDKNENMQTYMIENSGTKKNEDVAEPLLDALTSSKAAVSRLLGITGKHNKDKPAVSLERMDSASKIRKILTNKQLQKEESAHQKQTAIAIICCALCAASFVICINLFSNQNRIQTIEKELMSFKSDYISLSEKFDTATAQVFALQEAQTENPPATETPQPTTTNNTTTQNTTETDTTATYNTATDTSDYMDYSLQIPVEEQLHIYHVEEGDSLWSISVLFYGTYEAIPYIMAANNLDDDDFILPGQRLILP